MAKKANRWEYPFGIDGVDPLDVAMDRLGICKTTIYRMAHKGAIRMGRHPSVRGLGKRGMAVICRRSIADYLASIELDLVAS